jgi:hypothetical protein
MNKIKLISDSLNRVKKTLLEVGKFGFATILLNYILPIFLSYTHGNEALGVFTVFKNEINLWLALGMLGVFHFLVPISGKYRLNNKTIYIIFAHILLVSIIFSQIKGHFNLDTTFYMWFLCSTLYFFVNFIRSLFVKYINYNVLIYISYGVFVWLLVFLLIFGVHHVENVYFYFIIACLIIIVTITPYLFLKVDDYSLLKVINYKPFVMYYKSIPYVSKEVFQLINLYMIFAAIEYSGGISEVGYFSALLLYPSLVGFMIIILAPKIVSNISSGIENTWYYFSDNLLFASLIAALLFFILSFFYFINLHESFRFLPREYWHIILIFFISLFEAFKALIVAYLYGLSRQNVVAFSELIPFIIINLSLYFINSISVFDGLLILFCNTFIFSLIAIFILTYFDRRRQ